jgi:hypothetical protein
MFLTANRLDDIQALPGTRDLVRAIGKGQRMAEHACWLCADNRARRTGGISQRATRAGATWDRMQASDASLTATEITVKSRRSRADVAVHDLTAMQRDTESERRLTVRGALTMDRGVR